MEDSWGALSRTIDKFSLKFENDIKVGCGQNLYPGSSQSDSGGGIDKGLN